MNKENTEKLFKEFPEFFRNKNDMQKSLMVFGFACDDGWYNLIYNLCSDIKEWFENNESNHGSYEKIVAKKGVPEHFEIHQVKEKYGGLRFYTSPAPLAIHEFVRKAEQESYYICERCGRDIRKQEYDDDKYHSYYRDELPWIQTLCDICLEKEIDRRGLKKGSYVSDWQLENGAPFREMKI